MDRDAPTAQVEAMLAEALARAPGGGPRYRALSAALAGLIRSGALAPGAGLPPERDLARIAAVSRVTVRTALGALVEDGLLVRRQGAGTFVADPGAPARAEIPVQPLIPLSEELRRRGMVPRSEWNVRGLYPPLGDEIMALGLAVGDRVARLERVRLADERPLAIERAALPESVLPDPEAVDQSLYDLLAARGIAPVRAVQRVSAVNATPRDAATLGILPGGAVLKLERVTYLASGRAVEFTRAFYRGDGYDIVTELRKDVGQAGT